MATEPAENPVIHLGGSKTSTDSTLEQAKLVIRKSPFSPSVNVEIHIADRVARFRDMPTQWGGPSQHDYPFLLSYPKSKERPEDAHSTITRGQACIGGCDRELLLKQLEQEQQFSRFLIQRLAHYQNEQYGMAEDSKEIKS